MFSALKSSTSDRDFFILLQAGIWGGSEASLSPVPDWDYIIRLADAQTVTGIIAEGVSALKAESGLPADKLDQLLSDCAHISSKNLKISALQDKVCKILENAGLKYYVVKGQSIASLYRNPFMRVAGDIDIMLPMDDYRKARELIAPLADSESADDKYAAHKGYFIGNLEVELHGTLRPRITPATDSVMDRLQEDFFAGKVNAATFNAYYVFLHNIQHLHSSGTGLRQIVDWATVISSYGREIDYGRVAKDLADSGLCFQWDVFHCFAVEYLGMADFLKYESDTRGKPSARMRAGAADLWKACKISGNMGHFADNAVDDEKFWERKIMKLKISLQRYFLTRKISPNYAGFFLKRDLSTYWGFFLYRIKSLRGRCSDVTVIM